jgi:hypothetical protein
MNWVEWRAKAITALGPTLGTYTDLNGGTSPAIAIDPNPVAGRKIAGLEVVVSTSEQIGHTPAFNSYHTEHSHRITLKQWTAGATVRDALDRLLPILHPNVTIAPRIPANAKIGNIETQTLTFTEIK